MRRACFVGMLKAYFHISIDSDLRLYMETFIHMLKGNSHQILFPEVSLSQVEVLIEKLLPKILWKLGDGNPSKGTFTWRIPSRDDSTQDEIVQRLHDMIRPGMSGTRSR